MYRLTDEEGLLALHDVMLRQIITIQGYGKLVQGIPDIIWQDKSKKVMIEKKWTKRSETITVTGSKIFYKHPEQDAKEIFTKDDFSQYEKLIEIHQDAKEKSIYQKEINFLEMDELKLKKLVVLMFPQSQEVFDGATNMQKIDLSEKQKRWRFIMSHITVSSHEIVFVENGENPQTLTQEDYVKLRDIFVL